MTPAERLARIRSRLERGLPVVGGSWRENHYGGKFASEKAKKRRVAKTK